MVTLVRFGDFWFVYSGIISHRASGMSKTLPRALDNWSLDMPVQILHRATRRRTESELGSQTKL